MRFVLSRKQLAGLTAALFAAVCMLPSVSENTYADVHGIYAAAQVQDAEGNVLPDDGGSVQAAAQAAAGSDVPFRVLPREGDRVTAVYLADGTAVT